MDEGSGEMKFKEREPYLILTKITLPSPRYFEKQGDSWGSWQVSLCHFCRYAEWEGSYCSESELICNCGIEKIAERSEDIWGDSGDCWAFRPRYLQEDCVDMVGLLLDGWFPDYGTMRECYKPRLKVV